MTLFPNETLEIVFRHLTPSSVLVCAGVCKAWQSPAYRVYYETLLYRNDMEPYMQHISDGTLGKLVHTLSFENQGPISNDRVSHLLSYLPNLKNIKIRSGFYRKEMMTILKNNVHQLPQVQQVEFIDDWLEPGYQVDERFEMFYAFRHSLKHIHVSTTKGKLMMALPEFKQLSHLSITNHYGGNPDLNMFAVLKLHPQLVSYQIKTEHEEPQMKDMTSNPPYLKLKSFKVEIPHFSEWHINYVTQWLCLNEFQLVISSIADQWYKKIDPESLYQLGNYLKKVHKVKIQLKNVVCRTNHASFTTCLAYWPLIKPMLENNNVVVTVSMTDFERQRDLRGIGMTINKIGKKSHLSCVWNQYDFPSLTMDSKAAMPFDQIHELNIVECHYSIEQSLKWIDWFRQKYPMVSSIRFKSFVEFVYSVTDESMLIERALFDGAPLCLPTIKVLKLHECYWERNKTNKNNSILIDLSSSRLERLELWGADFFYRACASLGHSITQRSERSVAHVILQIEQENESHYFESITLPKNDYPFKFKRTNENFIDHRLFLHTFSIIRIKCLQLKEVYYGDVNLYHEQSSHIIHL